jgi:hypothetical protein
MPSSPEAKVSRDGNWALNPPNARFRARRRWLDGARQRQDIDPRRHCPFQRPGASLRRCAGGDHSVNHQELLTLDAWAKRPIDLEGPPTLRRRCSAERPTWLAVRRARLSTEQSTATALRRPTARASMADWLNRRHQPGRIERHRHDEIGIGEKLGPRLLAAAGEQWQSLVAIPIIEALDKLAHGVRIARRGPRAVVD